MGLSIKRDYPTDGTNTTRLSSNVFWNEDTKAWDTDDPNKDNFAIDIVTNLDGDAYVSFLYAASTTGEPTFTELIRIDKNGNIILYTGMVTTKTD